MTSPRISVVLPVYNEHLNIEPCLRGLWKALEHHEHEILVCYDFDQDSTLPAIAAMKDRPPSVRLVKNELGAGAANALRAGFHAASGDVIVTTMADLSDPPELIPRLADKMRSEGAAVVSGSRYARGGSQTGGPLFKRLCSQTASLTLKWFAGLSTHDATSNFRAYSREFIEHARIESKQGFEIALELTVKAQLGGWKVAEVPSTWMDRSAGESRFRMWKWAPNYLRWYWEAMAAPAFVWIVLLSMLAAAHVFVARYSSPLPMFDDLEWAPYVDSSTETTAEWWWSGFNEHRIPLPRAIFLALVRSTHDIRSGMYFDVYLLGAVSLAMILVARRLRGRTSYSDAFFPLLLLHWGNAENLLMMHQLSLIVPSAITCALLLIFTARADPPKWKLSLAIGLCIFSLPLCGAPGLTPIPAFVLWLLYAGWQRWRSAEPGARTSGAILLSSAFATALLLAFYFYDFQNPAHTTYNKVPSVALRQAWMFLSLGFGPGARDYWPLSGWITAGFILAALATLVLVFKHRPAERYRAAGILAVGAGIVSMAVSTGIARGGGYEYAAFAIRYVTLPAPLLCCVYFAFCLYGPAAVGRFVRVSLFSILVLLVFYNVQEGAAYGKRRALVSEQVVHAIESGMTSQHLAITFWQHFYNSPGGFESRMEYLRRFRFGPMADVRPTEETIYFPMLKTQPMLVTSIKAGPRKLGEETVLVVPPDCRLRFNSDSTKTLVEGRYGVYPLAYPFAREGGVRFSVELLQVTRQPQILFERVLDPENRPEDRGDQRLLVRLPPGADGELVLRTSLGSEEGDERAYAYWTEVEIR